MLRLRALVENCKEIPEVVRSAKITYAEDRILDMTLYRRLTQLGSEGESQAASVKRRNDALEPFVGRRLVCLVFALPGARYTVEIDAKDERIVHWEWQVA